MLFLKCRGVLFWFFFCLMSLISGFFFLKCPRNWGWLSIVWYHLFHGFWLLGFFNYLSKLKNKICVVVLNCGETQILKLIIFLMDLDFWVLLFWSLGMGVEFWLYEISTVLMDFDFWGFKLFTLEKNSSVLLSIIVC